MIRRVAILVAAAALCGCTAAKDSGTDSGGSSGDTAPVDTADNDTAGGDSADTTDTAQDSDTGGDSDTGTDTGLQTGLLTWNGEAVVGAGYSGTEHILLLGDFGLGDPACDIAYTVQSTEARDDCAECAWAWDVRFGAPEVLVGDRCEVVGYDEAAIAALEGTTRSVGLALDFMGHGNALMVYTGASWSAVALAAWSEADSTVDYEWAQSYVDY